MGLLPDRILRKDAIGVQITVTLKEDGVVINSTSLTTKEFIIVKPSGTSVTKAASFVTDGSDGKIRYTTLSGDLNEAGQYRLQANLVYAAGYSGRSEIGTFYCEENL